MRCSFHSGSMWDTIGTYGLSVAVSDIDDDGWPDIYVANDSTAATFYQNQKDKASGPGLADPRSSRGLAIADLFNDGRLEAVINNLSDRPMLLVNLARNPNHWLGLRLIGTLSNRDAIGARVTCDRQSVSGSMSCAAAPATTLRAISDPTSASAPRRTLQAFKFAGRTARWNSSTLLQQSIT
jgi:hypothetical protein